MKAIVVPQPGGPEAMQLQEVPDLTPKADEILVRVQAAGVNRADLHQREGHYPPPPGTTDVMGLEMAGEILQVGEQVQGWKPGERVMALLPGGGYAEQVIIPAGMAMPVPSNITIVEAGAIPEAFLTAYLNLFMLGELQQGQTVLVHSGGSGVGSATIQEAKAAGAKVFTTCSKEKMGACRELGADLVIDYKAESFEQWVKEATNGNGVDIILDFIGGPYLSPNLNSLALYGKLILIGQLGGSKAEIDLGLLMRKRSHILGTTLRARPVADKIEITKRFCEFGLPKLVSGEIRPIVDKTFNLADAADAHRYMASNQNFGKIVLLP